MGVAFLSGVQGVDRESDTRFLGTVNGPSFGSAVVHFLFKVSDSIRGAARQRNWPNGSFSPAPHGEPIVYSVDVMHQ
jgi:hypothetical protein